MDKPAKHYKQKQIQTKKNRQGRWSEAEGYLFQSLIETYGKNWKIIHSKMPNRSLCQIRSHAQKYLDKIGKKKSYEFQRRAHLLKALQTIEKAKEQQRDIFHPTKQEAQSHKIKHQQIAQEQNPDYKNLHLRNNYQEFQKFNSYIVKKQEFNSYQEFQESIVQKQEFNLQLNQNSIPNPTLVYMQSVLPYIIHFPTFYQYPFIINPQQIQPPNVCPITKMQVQQTDNIKQEAE